jgi:hypothetical protein
MNRSFMCHGICSDSSMDALATRYTFAEVNGYHLMALPPATVRK